MNPTELVQTLKEIAASARDVLVDVGSNEPSIQFTDERAYAIFADVLQDANTTVVQWLLDLLPRFCEHLRTHQNLKGFPVEEHVENTIDSLEEDLIPWLTAHPRYLNQALQRRPRDWGELVANAQRHAIHHCLTKARSSLERQLNHHSVASGAQTIGSGKTGEGPRFQAR